MRARAIPVVVGGCGDRCCIRHREGYGPTWRLNLRHPAVSLDRVERPQSTFVASTPGPLAGRSRRRESDPGTKFRKLRSGIRRNDEVSALARSRNEPTALEGPCPDPPGRARRLGASLRFARRADPELNRASWTCKPRPSPEDRLIERPEGVEPSRPEWHSGAVTVRTAA
jgi:hypothetical protein